MGFLTRSREARIDALAGKGSESSKEMLEIIRKHPELAEYAAAAVIKTETNRHLLIDIAKIEWKGKPNPELAKKIIDLVAEKAKEMTGRLRSPEIQSNPFETGKIVLKVEDALGTAWSIGESYYQRSHENIEVGKYGIDRIVKAEFELFRLVDTYPSTVSSGIILFGCDAHSVCAANKVVEVYGDKALIVFQHAVNTAVGSSESPQWHRVERLIARGPKELALYAAEVAIRSGRGDLLQSALTEATKAGDQERLAWLTPLFMPPKIKA